MHKFQFLLPCLLLACSKGFDKDDDDSLTTQVVTDSETDDETDTEETSDETNTDSEVDSDQDGYPADEDCDDSNNTIYPGADEIPDNGIDEDCDGVDAVADNDNDGFTTEDDCDDNNDSIYPGAPEIPDNGIDEDCDGVDQQDTSNESDLNEVQSGDLIITEIMQNPSAVDDADGEWFEIHNTSSLHININGLAIGNDTTVEHTISQNILIESGDFMVLGINSNSNTNGGILVDYQYTGVNLSNDDDAIRLSYNGDLIDMVEYGSDLGFPDMAGASMNLSATAYDVSNNDLGVNWCLSTSELTSGDYGSPGSENEVCPDPNDLDGDGYFSIAAGGDDCDDLNPNVYPGATEIADNGIDEDCSGTDLQTGVDSDGDGYTSIATGGTDCDDTNFDINPGAVEYSDGIDNDCDGLDLTDGICTDDCNFAGDGECDDGGPYASYSLCDLGTDCSDCGARYDSDTDGYYDDEGVGPLSSDLVMDCDDGDAAINPEATEIPDDGIDQNCSGSDLVTICDDSCPSANDGECDDGGFNSEYSLCDLGTDCSDCGDRFDSDGDGYDSQLDCDDEDATIYPGADCDICDGQDEDGDGLIDEDGDVDPYEPFDETSAILFGSLYSLGDNATIQPYIFPQDDVDGVVVFFDDDADLGFSDPDELTCTVTPASNVDINLDVYWEEDGTSGFVFYGSYNNGGVGEAESFVEDATIGLEDGGNYAIIVTSVSGESCDEPYTVYCEKTGD